ncbi:glycoside hydrolase family 2 protein [uncultured Leifsonia sp.]|uniref:glycoside hydrolase family 2 protein n=1 Tax=uncultured Leifsonia sp. TaxID=340359 RepID=UPI0025EB023D|nr:sugar-binding domain-containing protein [uncultured Leifsonia sp.]
MTAPRLHPRPQLSREEWTDLDGEWELRFDDDDRGLLQGWWRPGAEFDRTITVPFPPESPLSGIQEDGHATVWYRRHAALPAPDDGRVLLHFEAVDYRADVWVNGVHVASHEGGHVGFHADVTHALCDADLQTIVVRAFDDPRSLEQPRGKQDWEDEPHVIWYGRTTGIWRQVWAEAVPAAHISALRWSPGTRIGDIGMKAEISGAVDGLSIEARFSFEGVELARSLHTVTAGDVEAVVTVRDPRLDTEPERLLWSPETPNLIDVSIRLLRDGATVDELRSYVGLRTVGVEGERVALNGRPYFLRLVLEQAYWPQSHLAAPDDDALRQEVEAAKRLGFNGIRLHQTTADPRFLYWCDRLGLLVWADAPAAYRFSHRALARTTREWLELVDRDAGHPSVIAWVAFNESWGVPALAVDLAQRHAVRGLVGLLKALDPSRLVIGNDGWEYVSGDVIGVHDYTQHGTDLLARYGTRDAVEHTLEKERPGGRLLLVGEPGVVREASAGPVVLSEFGGVGFTRGPQGWNGYGTVNDEAAFLSRLRELVGAASAGALAGFCYTQLTDTLQERNGLLDEHRRPKADADALRGALSG